MATGLSSLMEGAAHTKLCMRKADGPSPSPFSTIEVSPVFFVFLFSSFLGILVVTNDGRRILHDGEGREGLVFDS